MKSKVKSQKSKEVPAAQEGKQEKSEVALREEEVLKFWKDNDIFEKSVETPAGKEPVGDFVFYDGPPFATGLPHYGNILAGTIKDAIPRFWTMNGYRVRRKWGWDCHGLPLENIIEKRLGLATKRDIEELGVKQFNETARGAVLEYADDWKKIVTRMGRWADMENDYKTMDPNYTESVWWVFSELHKKGLVYEGFKSMHLCPRCGTTLSNFEVNQGYKDIKDIAVTVKLPLLDEEGKKTDTSLLVWTTTPWTLPGNFAAAVHKDFVYAKVKIKNEEGKNENVILAKERLVQLGDVEYKVIEEMKGSSLIGKRYEPPFGYWQKQEFENKENAWKIYHAEYVEIGGEGTGAVHLAPAYGEDDMTLAKEHSIPIVHHVDREGHFMSFVTDFAGQLVKPKDDDSGVTHLDADIEIVKALKAQGKLFRKENITHSYPHCWRCETPLLNYATTSWFVEVTKIKDRIVEENKKVNWVPKHVGYARFGKWLEGARDWAISRQRYWGAPLPIWRNPVTKEYKVFGSLADLQEYVPKSENTLIITRHGESEFNTKGILNGIVGVENGLTTLGREQTVKAAQTLKNKKVDIIYYSPLQRTEETAKLLAKELEVSKENVKVDERILEMKFGEFECKHVRKYRTFFGSGLNRLIKTPVGGENWTDVKKRIGDFLYEINTKHKGKCILVVTHNGLLQMLQAVAKGDDFETTGAHIEDDSYDVDNAEVRELTFTPMPHNDNFELDYHRPYIDDIELVDTDGTKLERVPDVFDCWFESGSMPYAQHHYPFDPNSRDETNSFHYGAGNKETAQPKHFPAQFIAEGLDQTRGWFYSLIVLGVALFGKAPFKNVIVNGLVLAEDGKKMSKSQQNYPDPMELADRVGADAIRYYMLSSPIMRAEDLNFSEKGVLELQRKNIGRLHNVLAMYETYTNDSVESRSDSTHVLDKWIIARLNELIKESTEGFKNYELDKATRPVTDFIDDLSVWYLRRSRERLKSDDEDDKVAALGTLRYVLQQLALIMAPSMPFYSEYLWGKVKSKGDAESVHLAKWPEGNEIILHIINDMKNIREMVSLALEQRAKANIKVRQPLSQLKVKSGKLKEEFALLVKDEVNVKEVVFDDSIDGAVELDTEITPELKAEGDVREFIRAVQDMRKKQNLRPQDTISLNVDTSLDGQELLTEFMADIVKTVGANRLNFTKTEGEEMNVGKHTFMISISKT